MERQKFSTCNKFLPENHKNNRPSVRSFPMSCGKNGTQEEVHRHSLGAAKWYDVGKGLVGGEDGTKLTTRKRSTVQGRRG